MKNRYAVSIVWTKSIDTGMNIALSLYSDIYANSPEEAFGITIKKTDLSETHSIFKYLVHLITDNSEYNGD